MPGTSTAVSTTTKRLSKTEIDYSINSARYNQLEIYAHILEARTPTLQELCDLIPQQPVVKKRNKKRSVNPQKKPRYPQNWLEISRQAKQRQDYRCQVCNLQCLRPEDDRTGLSKSQIAQITANTHHISGNGMENDPSNLFVVCTTHHLAIHRGEKLIQGQLSLFDLSDYWIGICKLVEISCSGLRLSICSVLADSVGSSCSIW